MMPTISNDKKSTQSVQSLNDDTFDFEPDDFIEITDTKGRLFESKHYIEYLMDINRREIVSLSKGEIILVLYDFKNKQTDERVFVFLSQKKTIMYITKTLEEDFELLYSASEIETANKVENKDSI